MFDTLTYANKLKEAGFTERQAQAQAEALVAVVDSNLATKHDLRELELKFEGRFRLIDWMLGFILAGILSLVVKAFFAH